MEPTEDIKPTGVLGIQLRKVSELLADSRTFQQRCGISDDATPTGVGAARAAAFAKIKYPFLRFRTPAEWEAYYGGIPGPAGVIEAETCEWGVKRTLGAVHLRVLLVDIDRHPMNAEASLTDFLNFMEGVFREFSEQYSAIGLPIPRVSYIMPCLDNSKRRGNDGGWWLGGADLEWEPLL